MVTGLFLAPHVGQSLSAMEEAFVKLQAQFGRWTAPVAAPIIQATVQGGKRLRPTHFLSLRLKSPNLWKHAGWHSNVIVTA